MVRCQTFFFSLTQIKRYFAQEFSHTLKSRARVREREVDSAERVRLAFYAFLLLSGYSKDTVIATLVFGIGAAAAAVLGYLPPLLGGY